MRGDVEIENASLKDFLMQLIKNLGRDEITPASYLSKKFIRHGDTLPIIIFLGNPRGILSITMILEVKKEKTF